MVNIIVLGVLPLCVVLLCIVYNKMYLNSVKRKCDKNAEEIQDYLNSVIFEEYKRMDRIVDNAQYKIEKAMKKINVFNCFDFGDVCVKEKKMYCIDCKKDTIHQLGYYKGMINERNKIKFCTNCGKSYNHKWKD
ncbi:MAG: hypothetical protein K0R54_1829 [Clostridiaceae bacterium]|jgi:hypothetical protein|nr:hypothetical protein [Clostridiaceae bacterium]